MGEPERLMGVQVESWGWQFMELHLLGGFIHVSLLVLWGGSI